MTYIDEINVSSAIIETYMNEMKDALVNEAVIVGGGPSGLAAAYYLLKEGVSVTLIEKALRPGGGLAGGGMMFNVVVVQESAIEILKELEVPFKKFKEGYFTTSSMALLGALLFKNMKMGLKYFNLITVEDVMIKQDRVVGAVINWSSVFMAELHVDPLVISSKYLVDATGHDAEIVHMVQKKTKHSLIKGEGPMNADEAEKLVVSGTGEVFPGLYAAGMSVNAVHGYPRMGPIFGGMLLSGKRLASLIIKDK